VKILARVISLACVALGLFLVSRTFVLESRYASTMPRGRDILSARTTPVTVSHDVLVYVSEAEAKTLDTAQTYFTFGWPFVVLGLLLVVASRERRPLGQLSNEQDGGAWGTGRGPLT
jgi:hypothetical protein